MSIGDALKDMPDEYREYVGGIQGGRIAVNLDGDDPLTSIGDSEADKAITDGKPRWMLRTDTKWLYVRFVESSQGYLRYIEPQGRKVAPARTMSESDAVEILPRGKTPPPAEPAEPEKPKAVASIVFKHDGGEWRHMASNLTVSNTIHKDVPLDNWQVFERSKWYAFSTSDHFDVMPLYAGLPGRLTVTILGDGTVYEGNGVLVAYDEVSIERELSFRMERDSEPAYEPDSLRSRCHGINIHTNKPCASCPDCDSHTEPRSTPSGIETWCPVCNVKVESVGQCVKKPVATIGELRWEVDSNTEEDGRIESTVMHAFIDELQKSQSENRMKISM